MQGEDSITLTDALAAQAPVIQNLIQLYTHDFSEFWAGTSRGDVNAQGLFDAYPLEHYWSRSGWSAKFIWCRAALAGFSLLNDQTHSGLAANRNLSEFFILRKYRGRGIGRCAALTLFSQHPGLWEVAVARQNQRAVKFWRNIVRDSAHASGIQELDQQNAQWDGNVLRFLWGGVRRKGRWLQFVYGHRKVLGCVHKRLRQRVSCHP